MRSRGDGKRQSFWDRDYFRHWVEDPGSDAVSDWLEEERHLLETVVADFTRPAVLDVGCGYGRHLLAIGASCSRLVGIDSNPVVAAQARKLLAANGLDGAEIIVGDARKMDEEDHAFDVSICMTNTLGNIEDHKAGVLSEMRRLTKLGGVVVASVYSEHALEARLHSYEHVGLHVKAAHADGTIVLDEGLRSEQFTRRRLLALLRTAGFSRVDVHNLNKISYAVVARV